MSISDLQSAQTAGYSVIVNVPTSNFVLAYGSSTQTTLTAVTDTGFRSGIVLTLQPVSSTTSPIAPGYMPYTFAVQNNPQLQTWVQQVSAQTYNTLTLTANTDAAFTDLGNPGDYEFYVQVNSTQTQLVNAGSAVYIHPEKPGNGCIGNICPPQE